MKKNIIILCLLLFVCIGVMVGCGNRNSDEVIDNPKEYIYSYSELPISDQLVSASNMFRTGEDIVVIDYEWGNNQSTIKALKILEDGSGEEFLTVTAPNNVNYSYFSGDGQGNVYMLRTEYPIYETEGDITLPGDMLRKNSKEDLEGDSLEDDEETAQEDGEVTEGVNEESDEAAEGVNGESDEAAVETIEGNIPQEENMEKYYLLQYSLDGNLNWEVCLNDSMYDKQLGYFYVSFVTCTQNGTIFIGSNEKIFTYNNAGEFQKEFILSGEKTDTVAPSVMNMIGTESGNYYLVYYSEKGDAFVELNVETGALGEEYSLPGKTYQYFTYSQGVGYDLFLMDNNYLYGYNFGDLESVKLMSYLNSDLDVYGLGNIVGVHEEEFLALMNDSVSGVQSLNRFTKVDPKDVKDKKMITLACIYTDWEIKSAVVNFNKTNPSYRIQLIEYDSLYNTEEDYTAGTTQLNADIVSGKIPDIMVLESGIPIESYISKGLFEDLKPLIDSDPELSMDNFMPNVIEALSTEGHLYRISPKYAVSTLVGKTSTVGNMMGWTLNEAKELLASKPEGTELLTGYTQWSILYLAMTMGGEQFINWETGECNYNSEAFIELLEFVAEFPVEGEQDASWDENYWNEYEGFWRSDKVILKEMNLSNFRDYNYTEQGSFGEDITMIGFPTDNRTGTSIVPYLQMAVSSKSKNKEGAWEFIRYFLIDEYQDNLSYYFPLSVKKFDEMGEEALEKLYYEDENGNMVESEDYYYINGMEVAIVPMTREKMEQIKQQICSVEQLSVYNADLVNIITEESAAYFEGQKSVQEVAEIIQSRAQIYVSESR